MGDIMRTEKKDPQFKVLFPLSVKLIGMITAIVIASTVLITWLSSYFFMQDSAARAEENNLTLAQVFAAQVEAELKAVYTASFSFADTLRLNASPAFSRIAEQNFFSHNTNIAYIGVQGLFEAYNQKFFLANEVSSEAASVFLKEKQTELDRAADGELLVFNVSAYFGIPAMAAAAPYTDGGTKNRIVIIFSTENLQTISEAGGAFITYAVSPSKELLVYPDAERLKTNSFNPDAEFLQRIYQSPDNLIQFEYEEDGIGYFAASQQIDFAGIRTISQVRSQLVYEAAYRIAFRNGLLTLMVLLASILTVWFFAHGISRPVLKLTAAAERIESGDFNIDLKPQTHDEIGLLTKSFVKMGKGLAERALLRETFGKFVNKEVAERALKGELRLGGERKTATIFFSDIRSFTAISETMSPEGVVEFLNMYMTRMVDCIEQTSGVVDKFIGDAIMAVWGAPVSGGSPAADAEMAVRAALLMRSSLIDFNKDRGSPDKPILKIGCGLNTGPCLAGQIGSSKRMEYTVIGDSVNTASRIEALNKPFGTDILISENTYNLLKDKVITEPMQPIKVKGKTDPLQIYALINYKDKEGPQTLDELRTLLHITPPEGTVDPDKEEVKYEILEKK